MKKILLLISILYTIAFSHKVLATTYQSPDVLVKEVGMSAFTELKSLTSKRKSDKESLSRLVEKMIMPQIDMKYVTFKILDRNLRNMTREQRDEFRIVLKQYYINYYADILSLYSDQNFVFHAVQKNQKFAEAPISIVSSSSKAIDVTLKLRKNNKTGQWKIYDVVLVKPITQLTITKREIDHLIKSHGIDGAMKYLLSSSK